MNDPCGRKHISLNYLQPALAAMRIVAGFAAQIILGMNTCSPLETCFGMAFRTQFRACGTPAWVPQGGFLLWVVTALAGDPIRFPGPVGGIITSHMTHQAFNR